MNFREVLIKIGRTHDEFDRVFWICNFFELKLQNASTKCWLISEVRALLSTVRLEPFLTAPLAPCFRLPPCFQALPRRCGSLVFSLVPCFSPGWCSEGVLFVVSRRDSKIAKVIVCKICRIPKSDAKWVKNLPRWMDGWMDVFQS